LALLWQRDRRVRLGVLAGVVSLLSICVLAAAGLPLITRYTLLPASLLAIFAGAGVFGWLDLAPGARRTWWSRFALLALLVLVGFVPDQARRVERLGGALSRQAAIQDDLGELVSNGLPCRPIAVANRRPIPLLALWLRTSPEQIVDAQQGLPARGSYIVPRTPAVARDYILDKRDRNRDIPATPPDFGTFRADRSWRAFANC
jgi:hypothetical protein